MISEFRIQNSEFPGLCDKTDFPEYRAGLILSKNKIMSYYFNTTIKGKTFEEAIDMATDALKTEGFGVLTQVDIKETLKKKIDVDFRKYKILGACNPQFAHKALSSEGKIGVFLPCNVVVEENDNGEIEVSAVDPARRGSDETAVHAAAAVARTSACRRALSRCISRLCGWSFIFSVIVMEKADKPGILQDAITEYYRDRRGTD